MSSTNPPAARTVSGRAIPSGNLPHSRSLLLLLVFTAAAVAADQFAAPILHSSSPLWAVGACLVLVWRRGELPAQDGESHHWPWFSFWRLLAFAAAHVVLVLATRAWTGAIGPLAGTVTPAGTLVAAGKLSVLLPTILLLPCSQWRRLLLMYRAEIVAGFVVLLTYFPSRAIQALWPWYGQVLGRFVHALSSVLASGIGYISAPNPTLTGPDLDVTIIIACSGINGIELFDYLFGAVAIWDWNRLQKGRALAAYFLGLFAMLLGNALRITSLVVFGNRGFARIVSHYHVSAGWVFFSLVFLLFLSLSYGWMLRKNAAPSHGQSGSG